MTRSAAVSIENDFSKGLITEATAMNSPENSVVATDNCVYLKNGKVIRRLGIDYESNFAISDYDDMGIMASATTPSAFYNQCVINEFEWTSVNNDGSTSFIVIQIGDKLNFFKVGASDNISSGRKTYTVDINSFIVTSPSGNVGQFVAAQPCSFSSGFGYLFVTHPLCSPFYISYNNVADTITSASISLKIRDFERMDDSYAIDFRPTDSVSTMSKPHKYNLFNQGWFATATNPSSTSNVLDYFDSAGLTLPSNADIWWVFKNSTNQIDKANFDSFSLGNTPAPNGHYIYSAFDSARNSTMGFSAILPEYTAGNARPSQTAFFAGRVWYAGTSATSFSSKIYFSTIVQSTSDFGTCYQQADPTSEEVFDLQPSDGGVINIPDIAQIIRLVPVGPALLVFATNGIWQIGGGPSYPLTAGFAADNYSIVKVSTSSISSANSVVIVDGVPYWWDKAGIYTFAATQGGQPQVQNITELSIQTIIDQIPGNNIAFVKGVYNNINKTIHWLYSTNQPVTATDNYTYNKLLVFNVTSQSFSIESISVGPSVCGILFTQNSHFDPLINVQGASIVKFLTIGMFGTDGVQALTVSQFNDTSYLDWKTFDGLGVDFESFFITGYRIRGQLLKKSQSNYVIVILENEDNASCFIQGIWDYSRDAEFGRLTSTQQVYSFSETVDYTRVKKKMRGQGYSLQFKFTSESGKPFTLVGWVTSDTGENVP